MRKSKQDPLAVLTQRVEIAKGMIDRHLRALEAVVEDETNGKKQRKRAAAQMNILQAVHDALGEPIDVESAGWFRRAAAVGIAAVSLTATGGLEHSGGLIVDELLKSFFSVDEACAMVESSSGIGQSDAAAQDDDQPPSPWGDSSLRGPNPGNANFRGSNLWDPELSHKDLAGADLSHAYLYKADLTDADLTNANLSEADLTNADLTGADLRRANLRQANLFNASLTDADLTYADLGRANLSRADLTGANLTGVTYDSSTIWPEGFQPPHS